jgi:hypothetical protein
MLDYLKIESNKLMTKKMVGNNWELILVFVVVFGLVARIFIRFEPLDHFPNDDSSIFLYIGRSILNGQVPYLDVWDHKGPLLYYIDAFGLWIFGLWGVWIIEFVLMLAGLYIAYLSGRKLLGVVPSFVGIIAGYYLLNLFMAGNITEEYSIIFALLTFGLYFLYNQNESQKLPLWGIGFLFMCTFLIRPNNIGFQFAVILSMAIIDTIQKDIKGLLEKVYWIGLGMLTLLVPFLIYFGFNHALDAFYDQAFRYNFIYIENSQTGINYSKLLSSPINFLLYLTVASYGIVLMSSRKIMTSPHFSENRFVLLLLLAFPLEFFLSQISGRGYNHYYLTWAPYLIFAISFSVSKIFHILPLPRKMNKVLLLLIIIACFLVWPPSQMLREYANIGKYFIYNRANGIEKNHPLIDYIHDNTGPHDKVLLWGFGRWLTYLIDRESPSRYVYQFALTTPGYTTDEMVVQFARNLEYERPKFIIEAINYFIPLSSNELLTYKGYVNPAYIDIVKFIEENYHVVKSNYYFDGQHKEDKWIKVWMLNTPEENIP